MLEHLTHAAPGGCFDVVAGLSLDRTAKQTDEFGALLPKIDGARSAAPRSEHRRLLFDPLGNDVAFVRVEDLRETGLGQTVRAHSSVLLHMTGSIPGTDDLPIFLCD